MRGGELLVEEREEDLLRDLEGLLELFGLVGVVGAILSGHLVILCGYRRTQRLMCSLLSSTFGPHGRVLPRVGPPPAEVPTRKQAAVPETGIGVCFGIHQ